MSIRAVLYLRLFLIACIIVGLTFVFGYDPYFEAALILIGVLLFSNMVRLSLGPFGHRTYAEWKKLESSVISFPTIIGFGTVVALLVTLCEAAITVFPATDVSGIFFKSFLETILIFTVGGCIILLGWLVVFVTKQTVRTYAREKGLEGKKKETFYASALLCIFMAAFVVIGMVLMFLQAALPYLAGAAVCFIFSFLLFIANANDEDLNRPNTVRFLIAVFVILMAVAFALDLFHAVQLVVVLVLLIEGAITVLACYFVAEAYIEIGAGKKA